jgi:type VI secretion system (T6SS) effector TldE1-like protein
MWTYNSANGVLSHDGRQVGVGYSGHGPGVNNPAMQDVPNVGPIPQGRWEIGDAVDSPTLGPVAMPLTPNIGTETFGRGGFWCHGDAVEFAGLQEASHGCIILPRSVRVEISSDWDDDLEVV